MDTKMSVVLLSGLSLFMSLGAFAVSDDSGNDMNWSYAMGGSMQAEPKDFDELAASLPQAEPQKDITCTEGCPVRKPKKELTLTYEDEAMPIAERVEAEPVSKAVQPGLVSVREKMESNQQKEKTYSQQTVQIQPDSFETQNNGGAIVEQNTFWKQEDKPFLEAQQNALPQVETRYVETNPQQVQYPITRQYPISVQYPITVQRNMTEEQPVIMQQPVIVRRPVVVQQDVTVRRQPTVIQQQPMIMQQQPSFIQQQPVYVQAPALPMNQDTLNSLNGMLAQPQVISAPVTQPQIMPVPVTQPYAGQQNAYMPYAPYPQQYQVQGQIQAQPVYPMPTVVQNPQNMQQPVMPAY